jgi:hypothetical protein
MAMLFLRRLLLPLAVLLWTCILLPEFSRPPTVPYRPLLFPKIQEPSGVPITRPFANNSSHRYSDVVDDVNDEVGVEGLGTSLIEASQRAKTAIPPALLEFTTCPRALNQLTGHIRLPNLPCNISMNPRSTPNEEKRRFWNLRSLRCQKVDDFGASSHILRHLHMLGVERKGM